MTYRQDLWQVAVEHHGVVTTAQAEDAGVPAVELRKLAARGALTRVGHGVYHHSGVPVDDWTEPAATLATVGANAFLDGDTVLAMFDLALVNPAQVHVGTPTAIRRKVPKHVDVEVRSVPDVDLTSYAGLRAVRVGRALLDAVGHLLAERVIEAVTEAERRDLIDEAEARAILDAVARRREALASAESVSSP